MILFEEPLKKAIIVNRRNRFVMDVLVDDLLAPCHCPVTGRIGDIIFENIPCLVSETYDSNRKTHFTVEAISVDGEQWIGINQGRVNDYVEAFLFENQLDAFSTPRGIKREIVIGGARIDFQIDGIFMEVKAPLSELLTIPLPHFKRKRLKRPIETERLIRHLHALISTLPQTGRAVLLYVFLYDAPIYTGNSNRKQDHLIRQLINDAIPSGLEIWQLNCTISPEGIRLLRCFDTTSHFK